MNIRTLVADAVKEAQAKTDLVSEDKGKIHRERSKNFVECLSNTLLKESSGSPEVVSLSKHHALDREKFGMNELLFDITVLEYGTVDSGPSGKKLSYVTKGLWIVESELAKDKREALYDFNKLVLGASEKKLFIGPRVSDEHDYLRVLAEPAKFCSGEVYVALIPHPEQWPSSDPESSVAAWQWKSEKWTAIS